MFGWLKSALKFTLRAVVHELVEEHPAVKPLVDELEKKVA